MRSPIAACSVLLLSLVLSVAVAAAQTGTAADTGISTVTLGAALPAGTNQIGHIVCDSGCGGATSVGDNSAFTAGTTLINVTGGWYSSSPTSCTNGSACAPQLTSDRMQFVNLGKVGGSPVAVGQTTMSASIPVAVASDQSAVPVSGTVTANQGSANATPWNENLAQVGGVAVTATAKGTQGSNFVPVQRPSEGGRTPVVLFVDAISGIASEALATLTQNKGGTVTTGTSYTVTAGKTLRLIGGGVQIGNTSTTACNVRVRLRAAATVSVSSPVYIPAGTVASSNIQASGGGASLALPDGVEFAGGTQIGISHISNSTSCIVSFMVLGFEY